MSRPKTFERFVDSVKVGGPTDFFDSPPRGPESLRKKVPFPSALKQATFQAKKRGIRKGTLRGWFYLTVENLPENKPLVDWLRKVREPGASYFSSEGRVQRWQWTLPARKCMDIWNNVGTEILDADDDE